MRPYLAVLKDSFREALASRILWLLTGLITIVLFVGLAPFALREEAAARFQRNEFRNGPEFLKLLAAQDHVREPTAAKRIWSRLPESVRHRVVAVNPENVNEQVEVLMAVRGELNGMLNNDDLYDSHAWTPKMVLPEAKRLMDRGVSNLSPEDKRRMNRMLIDAAFPDHILPAPGKVLHAVWFGYQLGTPLPFEPKQLGLLVNFALAALTTFLAGSIGVFIAVLVTAPIVPLTFEPGAIDLLLSKPVSRSLLFLTKFFGASTFILINSIYLIGGMWLIAGLRFEIWSGRLLLCIPVLLFLFVIYYSVSAFTGVIWRNAIVSVCCAILFWGLCFAVGTAKNVAENTFLNPTRLAAIVPAGDKLLAVNRANQTFEWSSEKKSWEEVFRGSNDGGPAFFVRGSLMGPIYDAKTDRIYGIESARTRFDFFGGTGKLVVGPRKEDWRRIESAVTPSNPQAIFVDPQGQIIVVSLSGIYRLEGNPTLEHRTVKLFGIDIAPHDRSVKFLRIGPDPEPRWQRPMKAAMNRADGTIAVVSRGKLTFVSPVGRMPSNSAPNSAAPKTGVGKDDDPKLPGATSKYVVRQLIDLGTDNGTAIAFVGSQVALGTTDGRVRIFAGPSKSEQIELAPRGKAKPQELIGSPDGRWLAILYDDRVASLYDVQGGALASGKIAHQGDLSAIAFTPTNQLLASDGFGHVNVYDTNPLRVVATYAPPAETLEILYRYVVTPLYTIFPKPSQLDDVVTYLVVGDPIDLFDQNRAAREELNLDKRPPIDIWRPIWTNFAFLAVMLTITCIYIARRDF